ncbi:MAG: hypothetical protein RIF32_15010, partial [Leptospirales bacterium]
MAERNASVIRHVILYKHGIGFFKREAIVEGDGVIELQFKTKEMNDVLKSLTVYDADGGLVPGISYEGHSPAGSPGELDSNLPGRTSDDTGLEYPRERALSGLLGKLIGVRLALKIGDAEIIGEILGLETFPGATDLDLRNISGSPAAARNQETRLVLRCDGGALRSVNLLEASEFRLLDDKVEQDVSHLLASVVYWKKKAARKIMIHSRGSGERRVALSYAVEAPVWKTSYRILLPDRSRKPGDVTGDSRNSLRVQGWALVDNPHDEDWDDVRLSLVAGLPVSFTHDLYSPRYQQRPAVAVDTGAAYGSPEIQKGGGPPPPAAARSAQRKEAAPLGNLAGLDFLEERPQEVAAALPGSEDIGGSFDSTVQVSGGELDGGNAYVYHLEHPVSVGRGQSALVPILAADFEGARVALYSPKIRGTNPMASILLKNTTDLTLEGGPATVFDLESYAGEGMLSLLKPGESQFVAYAVELGCRISSGRQSAERGVYRSVIINGAWSMYHRMLGLAVYTIDNQANPYPLELYIEHEIRNDWRLAGDEAADPALEAGTIPTVDGELYETTTSHYRFKVIVPVGETVRFVVCEIGGYTNDHS